MQAGHIYHVSLLIQLGEFSMQQAVHPALHRIVENEVLVCSEKRYLRRCNLRKDKLYPYRSNSPLPLSQSEYLCFYRC
ncbi:Uncharacterised protein [Vibrio cholerae]|nr:Uncharacterised protein [Vibrio cholerae]CSI68143.1 Uncharacterised protein [Vibrio cholerae]